MAVMAKPGDNGNGNGNGNGNSVAWTLTYSLAGATVTLPITADTLDLAQVAAFTALAAIPGSAFMSIAAAPNPTKSSAMAKLVKLGLTADEATAICGG